MKKGKSITLLTIISVLLAALIVMTFARFPIGIQDYNSVLGAISLDYDLAGGTAYTLTLANDNEEEVENVDDVMKTLGSRLNELGYSVYNLTAIKDIDADVQDYNIRIETRTTDSIETDIAAVAAYGSVKFYGGTSSDPTTEIMNDEKAVADSKYMGSFENQDGSTQYQASVVFTDYGYEALTEAINSASSSDSSSSYYLKITLGETTLLNAAITVDSIMNKTVYITSQSEASAKQMAMQIRTGGLAYKYEISEGQAVSATFGENTPLYAVIAVAAVIVAAIVALAILYKGYGIIAALSMLVFVIAELGMLVAVPGINLSFGGVAGIIVASVITIYGLFIFAKRFSEEYASGKTVKAAVKAGYKRAFMPILNSNVAVGVVALLLFIFTGGALQNFGITLGIGIVLSFVTTVLISAMFVYLILPLLKNGEKFFNLKRADK